MTRPLPSPDELRGFAERVVSEQLRAAVAGEPDAPLPFRLRSREESARAHADVTARNAQAAEAWLAANDERQQAAIAADPALTAQLAELVGAAPAHNLVTEGRSQQRSTLGDRFSQQAIPRLGRITDGALAVQPVREPIPGPEEHDGHRCCQDQTRRSARTLVGRRPELEAEGDLGVLVLPLRCRSWRCACCNPRLLQRNRARAMRGASAPGRSTWFCTVTIDPTLPMWRDWLAGTWEKRAARAARGRPVTVEPYRGVIEAGGRMLTGHQATARASIPYASASWNRLRLSLEREFGGRISYYRAVELHKSGMAHLHLLMRTGSRGDWFMHFARFRQLLVRAGFGRVTDVQLINSPAKVARYVTKMTAGYTSKSAELMPKWTRRGTWSRDWCEWEKPTPIAGFTWELDRAAAAFVAAGFIDDGYRLLDPARFRVPAAPT